MTENRVQEIKETAYLPSIDEDGVELAVIFKDDFDYLVRMCESRQKIVADLLDEASESFEGQDA